MWHHVHVWLDADTWHWAWLEIGSLILLIVIICLICAAVRSSGGSSGYSHSKAVADQRARADATLRSISHDYDTLDASMRRYADDWHRRR